MRPYNSVPLEGHIRDMIDYLIFNKIMKLFDFNFVDM